MPEGKRSSPELIAVATVFLLALGSRLAYIGIYGYMFDDAYITFRFARNIVDGVGFAYNAGESVYGASSPLYTLIVALLSAVLSPGTLPSVARWLGLIGLLTSAFLLYRYLPLTPLARLVMLIGLLSYPRIYYSSTGGMEECFIFFLMALSVVALARSSPVLLGLAVGLLFVTKVDTVIWTGCLLLIALLRRQRSLGVSLGLAAAVALPWIIYSFVEFGSILPHTIEAKQVAYTHWRGFRFMDALLLAVPDGLRNQPVMVLLFVSFWYGVLGLSLWRMISSRDLLFLPFPLYCVAYTLALFFSGTAVGLWTRWTVPLLGCLVVCFGYLVQWWVTNVKRFGKDSLGRVGGIVLTVAAAVSMLIPILYPNREALTLVSHREAGDWLRQQASPGESIMLEPIGYIGYVSGLYVHDFIGLVSHEITERRLDGGFSDRWFARYLKDYRPTYVMLRVEELRMNDFIYGGYGDGIFTPDERAWFDAEYQSVLRTDVGPSKDWFEIFRLVSAR